MGFAPGADLVFDLQISQPLMVEYLAEVPPVEVQMGVAEMDESDHGDEDDQIGVFTLTFRLERIFTRLVTVRHIVHVVLLLEGVGTAVAREVVHVAVQSD